MSEKWSIERLFDDENDGNPFQCGPTEMLLWECHGDDEAFAVWRGYDANVLKSVVKRLSACAPRGVTYCVEFPSRKGERDSVKQEKRDPVTGAKCLPNARQRLLLTMIEDRWGAALNEQTYMASRGEIMDFYMKSDKSKASAFTFYNWDDVQAMAYTRP